MSRMRGTPTRARYSPHDMRPIDLPPSRSSPVSWSLSNDSATAQRAPPGHVAGARRAPARTWPTNLRQIASSHCHGSPAGCIGCWSMTISPIVPRLASPVDRQDLAVDEARQVGGEEHHRLGDIVRRAQALERDAVDQRALALRAVGVPLRLAGRIAADEARRDAVDPDAVRAELMGELARQAEQRVLGRAIG